jgi:hypothetical protein
MPPRTRASSRAFTRLSRRALIALGREPKKPRSNWCAAWRWRGRYLQGDDIIGLARLARDTQPAALGSEQSDIHRAAVGRLIDEVAMGLGLSCAKAEKKITKILPKRVVPKRRGRPSGKRLGSRAQVLGRESPR